MKKAVFFALIAIGIVLSMGFASAGSFGTVAKWAYKNIGEVHINASCGHCGFSFNYSRYPNYNVYYSYNPVPRNTYYAPPQQYYYGYGAGTYYPKGYYYTYSGTGYGYSGPVVVYD